MVDDKGGLLLMDLAVYFRDTDGVIFQEEFTSKNKGIKEMWMFPIYFNQNNAQNGCPVCIFVDKNCRVLQ